MRRHHSIVVSLLAVCLTLSSSFNPAFGSGLISTEQVVAAQSPLGDGPLRSEIAQAQRSTLESAMVAAGVDASHARSRLAGLTDTEIAELTQRFDSAPAGGLWFMPFLIVAAVIGMLIATRSEQSETPETPSTDLFGRPSNLAVVP